MHPLKIAMIQNSAGADPAKNLAWIERQLHRLSNIDLVVLPEVFALRGADEDYRRAAEKIPGGPTIQRMVAWARKHKCWLLLGSLIESHRGKFYNTSVLLDRRGAIAAVYRKIHLFEARLDNGQVIREKDVYTAGSKPVMVDIEGWKTGLSICYDLRFPELFRQYSKRGAALLLIPSNFTQRTGRAHWETLVRARAIENQCFVVAANQCGVNPRTGVASHGKSLAVGPWGEVMAQAGGRPGCRTFVLCPKELRRIRGAIPVLTHRVLA
jgi:predicted amidohydrolase